MDALGAAVPAGEHRLIGPFVPGFVVAAAAAFVAPVGLLIAACAWRSPAARVPVHWGAGGADAFDSSAALLWSALLPSVVTAALAVGLALLLDGSSGRRSTAAAFAVLVLFGSLVVLQWPVAQLTAQTPSLHDGIGAPFLLSLLALLPAAAAGTAALLGRRRGSRAGRPGS